MTEYSSAPRPAHSRGVPIALLVGAALLVGVGIGSLAYYLITFSWLYLGGAVLLAVGGYLLFTRASGPDRA